MYDINNHTKWFKDSRYLETLTSFVTDNDNDDKKDDDNDDHKKKNDDDDRVKPLHGI